LGNLNKSLSEFDLMGGEVLIRATIIGAMLAYAIAEWLRFRRPAAWRAARLAWTAGALLAVAHAAAALHVRHAWSQRDALASTASQTAAVTGVNWGGGLYVNYAFLTLWTADAAGWWYSPSAYRNLPPSIASVRVCTFLFMFVNGAVVFARGPTRWLGLACVGAATFAWYFRHDDMRVRSDPN
jgi:hypothetical protein